MAVGGRWGSAAESTRLGRRRALPGQAAEESRVFCVVPVAILTTDDFDASTVDPVSVVFAGAAPLRWATEDVDYDGDLDLIFHFKTQELNLDENSTEATLTGETFGGVALQGSDSVNIVPK